MLEYIASLLSSLDRRRIIMDHVNPSEEYMHRHYLYGKPDGDDHGKVEVCLHKILRSDDDFCHNHPACFFSMILSGSYREHTPTGSAIRRPGHIRVRSRNSFHRLELVNGPVYTLFIFLGRSSKKSKWGFLVNGKYISHEEHLGL